MLLYKAFIPLGISYNFIQAKPINIVGNLCESADILEDLIRNY